MIYFDESQSLAEIKEKLRKAMAVNNDPYTVALLGLNMRYTYTLGTEPNDGFASFLAERIWNRYDLDDFLSDNQESEALNSYLQLLAMYYLISEDTRQFKKIVNWLPGLTPTQKQLILSWPRKMILSVFKISVENNLVSFQDIKDDEVYSISFADPNIPRELAKYDTPLLTFIVPTDTDYLSTMALSCQPSEDLKKILREAKSKKDSELALINWFFDTAPEISEFSDDLFDQEFHPAARKKNESTIDFARRLLAQDDKIIHFKYYDQFEGLMIKVIDTFPQMFFSAANAFPLLQAMKQLFTLKSEVEDFLNPNFLSDFWELLIREHLPKEVKKLKRYRVSDDYWDEGDYELDLSF
ncbi:hypothetical protein [Enterococcus avium]|uniref:hypothetical protein n=1 Tax=Enterococcus avium TaxID=33945 RepID=UPI003DA5450F